MSRYIILLRGINVSGKNILRMDALRAALNDAGFGEVTSYLQSGNLSVTTDLDAANVAHRIHEVIRNRFELTVPLQVLTENQLIRTIDAVPFTAEELENHKAVHVFFLTPPCEPQSVDFSERLHPSEKIKITHSAVYLLSPQGIGTSKITTVLIEKSLNTMATARNWKTVQALRELLEQ